MKKQINKSTNTVEAKIELSPSFRLIDFDLKARIYITSVLLAFVVLVLLKIHGSSIPIWNQVANDGGSLKRGLITGTPQSIRSDEWLCYTPFILSQKRNDNKPTNSSWGIDNTMLMLNVPVNHFITLFRPNLWGFYFLSEDQAYAWFWNFKLLNLLISSFLFFMLLTANKFYISVFGSIWLTLSSGVQWWFSTYLPDNIASLCAIFVLTIYILFTTSKIKLSLYSALLLLFGVYFTLMIYPPYQIPLIYCFAALLITYLWDKHKWGLIQKELVTKCSFLAVCGIGFGVVCFLFYKDTESVINVLNSTVYPGKRVELGGSGFTSNIFSEYFTFFINATNFPNQWSNICELSHFINYTPVAFFALILSVVKKEKLSITVYAIAVFQAICLLWIYVGFPQWLSKITLFSMSPAYRMVIPFGVSNVILTILLLGRNGSIVKTREMIIMSIVILVFLAASIYSVNSSISGYFSNNRLILVILFMSACYFTLLFSNVYKSFPGIFMLLTTLLVVKNTGANPISKGLDPIRKNSIGALLSTIERENGGGKWVVFGQFTFSNFLKANGLPVISGTIFAPNIPEMRRVFDPLAKKDSVYNRYAHVVYSSFIDGKDSVVLNLVQSDLYSINMDPCSSKLDSLGVKYFLFSYQPQPAEVRCMTPLYTSGVFVYKKPE